MYKTHLSRFSLWLWIALAVSTPIRATAITSFPGTGTIINFDDLQGGNCHLCGPSITTQYAGLGVTFDNPTFPGEETEDTDLTSSIPDSSPPNALFIYQGGGGPTPVLPFQILFSNPVNTVGFDWLSSFAASLQLDAYDRQGVFLETVTIVGTASLQGLEGFSGVQEPVDIGRLDLSYHPDFDPTRSFNLSIDNLTFAEAVPEPSTVVMIGLGFASTILLRSRRRR
jgi:hypothetical protein